MIKRFLRNLIIVALLIIAIFELYQNRETIMKKIYVTEYSNYVEKYSKEYEVDKYLIYAIIKAESNFNEDAKSSKGAKGLMQLMYSTAKETAKSIDITIDEKSIMEPETNIQIGTKYISKLLQKYNNIELALAAYNAGSGNVDSWINSNTLKADGSDAENIPYKETNNYVRKIMRDYEIYKRLYTEI